MSAPSVSAAGAQPAPLAPRYRHFTDFAERWLLPYVNVRLAEANRENTYTWCRQWWAHRAVAVRIAHLHSAFEGQRRSRTGTSLSTFLLSVDGHLRTILDAANGPLYRCTRLCHVSTPSLPFDPVPAGWFGRPTGPKPTPAGEKKAPPPVFAHYSEFVQGWLLPVTSVRIAANNREGQYSWCRQWWRHHSVVVRFAAIHLAFEAGVRAEDPAAMSTLFLRHIDVHLREVLDAAKGPLHRCTPDQHVECPGLSSAPIPTAWFGPPGASTPTERLGFGPDFRTLAETITGRGTS
ncbi:DUF4913 domain-containing protein [Nocardia suismassiliense]|uniref:DUF4913 domain-containing protein n=1 Tax=Nocardia suismassiliense TaxID=2077092 RepID=A0ABW6QS85_9NOCA